MTIYSSFLLHAELLLPCYFPIYEWADLYLHFSSEALQKELPPLPVPLLTGNSWISPALTGTTNT